MRRLLMVALLGFLLAAVVAFTAEPTTEPPVTPSHGPPPSASGGTLLWIWLASGAVLLAALVFVTLRVRRPGR